MTASERPSAPLLAIGAAIVAFLGCASCASRQSPTDTFTAEQLAVLALPFGAFDQDLDGGWRAWAQRDEHTEAARMLGQYAATHDELTDSERRIIAFHAGQMYAWLEQREIAADRFRAAINPDEPTDAPFKWNTYVEGTIAFLQGDLDTLQNCRDQLTTQDVRTLTMPDGTTVDRIPNLDVLERFMRYFEKSYREAYSGQIDPAGAS